MSTLDEIYSKFEQNKFHGKYCFLCGTELNEKNKSIEHVIPRWLQKRYNLWDQKLGLLNGTEIFYRHLTIPCCKTCNNEYLKPLEDSIKGCLEKGITSFRELQKETLFYWLGKIYFGIMYKELFLHYNQKRPNEGRIVTSEYLKSFQTHFIFLQGIRNLHRFKDFFPASIYIMETQSPLDIMQQWDFIDMHNKMFIAIRMGNVGIMALLQDGETTKQLQDHLSEYFSVSLHPLQFRELACMIMYKSFLMNRIPKYISYELKDCVETLQMPLMGLSGKPIFDAWDNEEYAAILTHFTGMPLEYINPEPGKVRTWIKDEEGKPLFFDVSKDET